MPPGGRSHDLRNVLATIRTSAYYVRTRVGPGDARLDRQLARIDEQVEAACRLLADSAEVPVGPRILAAQAYGVPQAVLQRFADACQDRVRLVLAVDTPEGLDDLARLAGSVDLLLYARERGGFGSARRKLLLAGRALGAGELLLADADGQYAADDLLALPPLGEAAAAIPQRDRVDLPLARGRVNRLAAEALQAWCVAHGAGRPDLGRLDMQPGAFLLGPRASRLLAREVTTSGFAWDLEATWRLLASGLPLAFPTVATRPQEHTSFTEEDAQRLLGALLQWFGRERVLGWTGDFVEEARSRFPEPDLADLRSRLERLTPSGP